MKYIKILALALCGMALTACSNDDEMNSAAGVSVEMGVSEISVKENVGEFRIPVKVTGEANGPIKIQVKVEGTGSNPAIAFEERNGEWSGNYIVTSETLNIPAGETTVYVDMSTVDDFEENAARTMTVTIASAEGAAIGAVSSTQVTILDNDALPYDKIQGAWTMNYTDYDGKPASMSCNIVGYDENTAEYGKLLSVTGFFEKTSSLDLEFYENEETGEVTLTMHLPEPISYFKGDPNLFIWVLGTAANGNPALTDYVVTGTYDVATKTITFDQSAKIWFYVASPDFSNMLGILDAATGITFKQ